jgi:hypothetical protein
MNARPQPALPAIEVAFPSLAPYAAGNTGIPYVWTFAAVVSGPHVLIQALTHGNEVCGAIALDRLLRDGLRPTRGTLSLVFANVAAYQRFDPSDPFASRCIDEDFNRLWTAVVLDGPRSSVELTRARELRPLYNRVDYLLDLHSMSEPCLPLAMAGTQRKGIELARAIAMPPHVIIDGSHVAGKRLRDYTFSTIGRSARAAGRVRPALGSIRPPSRDKLCCVCAISACSRARLWLVNCSRCRPNRNGPSVTATVTITTDAFRFTQPVHGLQTIPRAITVYASMAARKCGRRTTIAC